MQPSQPHPTRALMAVVGVSILLACLYNWATPLFENSDEFFHFPLIVHLADNGLSLPLQSKDSLQDWRQQGNQPPLYHLLSAILISPFDTSDYAQVRRLNPHAQLGIAGESNLNAVLHPLDRSKEFKGGTAWALRVVRLFSTLLGAVVVICTYWVTVYAFPDLPRWVGVLAAGLVAFNPMAVFVASSVNNDNLSNALITAVLALLFGLYRREELPPIRILLLVGVLLGLSLLSKLSTGPFMLLVGVFWLALAIKHRALRYMIQWGLAALVVALLISGWWYYRNYDLYGDPSGLNVFLDIAGRRAVPLTAEQLWSERDSFIQSFWGLYGGVNVPMASWVYTVFNLLAAVSGIGAALYVVKRRKLDFLQASLPIWAIIALISLIRWTALTWATQGRLWFIALAALGALSAVGFYEIGRRLKRPQVAFAPPAFALIIALAAPVVWIRPAYAAPKFIPMAAFEDTTALTVYHDPEHPDQRIALLSAEFPAEVEGGQPAEIELTFCTETPQARNWSVFVHLVNEFDIILAQADFTPGRGALPTAEMEGGNCWRDVYPIKIEAGIAPQDTPLSVLVGLYDHRDNTRMIMENPADGTRYLVRETQLKVGDALRKFAFGDVVRLNGYQLSSSVLKAGETLTIIFDWEVVDHISTDYTVFVQVLDARTAFKVAASDQMPSLPTSQWRIGDKITDTHRLQVADDAPAGVYAVLVGFYRQPKVGVFERLRLSFEGVDTGFDAFTLTWVKVE